MEMKTATFLPAFRDYGKEGFDIAATLKRFGFDGAEPIGIAPTKKDEPLIESAKKLRESLDGVGIPSACYSKVMNMVDKTPEEAVKELCYEVDVCEVLGSPILHHTIELTLRTPVIPLWEKYVGKFADVCREVAYYAGEKGITCVYEDQGFYVNTPERLSELLCRVDLPNTGICLDTGNALFNELDPIEFVAVLAPFIKHVHVKDYIKKSADKTPPYSPYWYRTSQNNMLRSTIVGHGVIDFEPIFETLILAGYDGYYSIESGGIELDNEKAMDESLKNMKWMYANAHRRLTEKGLIK